MRIWGYILVVLNLLAAGAFLYFGVAVWKSRSEWQYALLRQQIVNRGLPLEAPKNPPPMDGNFVPFDFTYDFATIDRLDKAKLKDLVPPGGDVLGAKGPQVIANQTDEAKRVEKVVFDDLAALDAADRRLREMILLLNLAQNNGRTGVYGLLRDFTVDKRRAVARGEMAFLGRTPAQTPVLTAMAALGEAMIGEGPNFAPDDRAARSLAARKALMTWAFAEVPNIVPEASLLPPHTGDAEDRPQAFKDRDRLIEVLNTLRPVMESPNPDQGTLDQAKDRLTQLMSGEEPLRGEAPGILLPYLIAVATNPLKDATEIDAAKAELLKLLKYRSTTKAEETAMAALADLMVPPAAGDDEAARADLTDTVAKELLRSYFEDAIAPPSTDLPDDVAQARTKLLGMKPIRTVAHKRRAIAHLLYHMDAHVGTTKDARDEWYRVIVLNQPYTTAIAPDPNFTMLPPDEAFLKARVQWHKRVAAIVGLEAYAIAVENQATQLQNMIAPLRSRIFEEQSHFETEFQNVVNETKRLAADLETRQANVEGEKVNRDAAAKRLGVRLAELQEQQNKLAVASDRAKRALAALELKVDELYQITKQLGEAQDALVGLEATLRNLELPTVAPKKSPEPR